MSDVLPTRASGHISADRIGEWIRAYARGDYTEVVRDWLSVRASAPADWADTRVLEAVGWSLALTKSWDAYELFHADVVAGAGAPEWLAALDAWHAVHDSRYDAAAHGARTTREQLLAPGKSLRLAAYALRVEGVALFRLGRYLEAEVLMRRALEMFEASGEPLQISQCATNLGLILNAKGELAAARAELARAADALVAAGAADERLALARVNLAVVELHLGHVDAAHALYERSLEAFERLGLVSERITALNGLGHCARVLGHLDAALAQHRAALHLASPQLARQLGLCHEFIARVLFEKGERAAADSHYKRAFEIAAHIAPEGDLMLEVCWHFAELMVVDGRLDRAAELLDRAEALCDSSAELRELGCVQRARARWLAACGDRRALELFETATATLEGRGRVFEAIVTRIAHGDAAVELGARGHAVAQWAAARHELGRCFPNSSWIDRVETRLAV